MGNVNEYVKKNECTGCGACYNKCTRNAIKMEFDENGFLSPIVDKALCNGCSKCIYACPMIFAKFEGYIRKAYVAQNSNEEIRLKSSSGGIFFILAEEVIRNGGYVVGTILNKNLLAETIITNKIEDAELMMGSKYMQSDTKGVFKEIRQHLDNDKEVFYTSTPCQIAGLKTYLEKNYPNLITIDLMCHGGSSPGLFNKYLNEFYGPIENIKTYSFRDKAVFGWSTEANIYFKDGTEIHKKRDLDYWYKSFLPCINVREVCGSCKFAKNPRQGDITLADFWGVKRLNEGYDDGKGTSLILVNSDKGEKILRRIKPQLRLLEEVDYETVLKFGQPIEKSFKCHPARKRFFELNKITTFEKAYEYSVLNKYDVGIVGVWSGLNFGSALTYYALYKIISSFGLSVLMIEVPTTDPQAKVAMNHSRKFISENCKISRRYLKKDLKSLSNNVDTFITGSDQLWNFGISKKFGKFFYLDFVDRNCKKISYSTSFGHAVDFAPKGEREAISYLLNDFDSLSVREKDGVRICKEIYGVKQTVSVVLDPVFLLSSNEYARISRKSKLECANYVLLYILDFTQDTRARLDDFINSENKTSFIFLTDAGGYSADIETYCKNKKIDYKYKICIEDFLYLFINSDSIVTDSFHGSCFSILFKKKLSIILNKRRGPSRINSLCDLFNLSDCICLDKIELHDSYVADFNLKIKTLKDNSIAYLKNAIYSPKKLKNLKVWEYRY